MFQKLNFYKLLINEENTFFFYVFVFLLYFNETQFRIFKIERKQLNINKYEFKIQFFFFILFIS
jgi:hypothetical protein